MNVRAIDLRTESSLIEVCDFNALSVSEESAKYDVIVCSMVINCVPTPERRGVMLRRLRNFTKVGGLVFLMLPLLCVTQSKYLTKDSFLNMLVKVLKFEIREVKETPKILFVVLVKREGGFEAGGWGNFKVVNRGKKFRNEFAVCFEEEEEGGGENRENTETKDTTTMTTKKG